MLEFILLFGRYKFPFIYKSTGMIIKINYKINWYIYTNRKINFCSILISYCIVLTNRKYAIDIN